MAEHLDWHGARLNFLGHFILALFQVRTVNLAEIATAFSARVKPPSSYRRLQRFFAQFALEPATIARLVVATCWDAYERFVLCAAIAHGLLQLIVLSFGTTVWLHHTLYLRTQSRSLPSEKTVKQVIAPRLIQQFIHLPQNSILLKIQRCLDNENDDDEDNDRWVA